MKRRPEQPVKAACFSRNVWALIHDFYPNFLTGLFSGVLFLLSSLGPDQKLRIPFLNNNWASLILWISICALISWLLDLTRKRRTLSLEAQLKISGKRIASLEDFNEKIGRSYRDLLGDTLGDLSRRLNFKHSERVSVYKHEESRFSMLGRHCDDPILHEAGRGIYPDDEGCIGKAWREGEAFLNDLPDPDADFPGYCKATNEYVRMRKRELKALRMKSRSYYAKALRNADRKVAVIVFESNDSSGINREEIDAVLEQDWTKAICDFLRRMKSIEPSAEFAKNEGY